MSLLRDYFAVNAPDVPDWFQVTNLDYPKFSLKEPQHPEHFSNEEIKKVYYDWLEDPVWDLDHPELEEIAKEWEHYWKQRSQHQEQRKAALRMRKITSWRYFYADQMIEMRKTNKPKPLWLKHPQFAFLFMLLLIVGYLISVYLENSYAIL